MDGGEEAATQPLAMGGAQEQGQPARLASHAPSRAIGAGTSRL